MFVPRRFATAAIETLSWLDKCTDSPTQVAALDLLSGSGTAQRYDLDLPFLFNPLPKSLQVLGAIEAKRCQQVRDTPIDD